MSDDLEALARRFLLQNAVLHGGKADGKSTLGRVMGSDPAMRPRAKELAPLLMGMEASINAMSPEEQKEELARIAPELMTVEKRERKTGLKELKDAEGRKVVLRFAPNPNGPLSFGHGRGVAILQTYREDYDGELILRLDDTDPQVKPPLLVPERGWNGYEMIQEDLAWLAGAPADRVVKASDRIEVYYEYARKLIELGGAYVCDLEPEAWRESKNSGIPSPHRDDAPDVVLGKFEAMVAGAVPAGSMVLRIKTDMQHKDPALRDWTAFRVVREDAIHPREARGEIPKFRCWPLLDFQSAIEDQLQGVTHIVRGKDLMDSTRKQEFLYRHFGWTYPQTLYWGRVSLFEFGAFSTSSMRRGIESGVYEDWDDVRLPTLRALKRRGFQPEAIRKFWFGLGITEKDIAASVQNLEAENAKIVDPASERRSFVPDPVWLNLSGAEGHVAKPLRHPSKPALGHRTLEATDRICIPSKDLQAKLRLKDLGNIEVQGDQATFTGEELVRDRPILQWLPEGALPFTVLRSGPVPEDAEEGFVPSLDRIAGVVEPDVASKVGEILQFERFGFVRIEAPNQGVWLHE